MMGMFLALISTASWAFCSIRLKKLGKRLDAIGMTTITTLICALLLFLAVVLGRIELIIPKNELLRVALSGILGIAVGDCLYYASLNRLSPIVFSLFIFIAPELVSGVFGYVFLKECPPLIVWIGILILISGLGIFLFPAKSDNKTNKKTNYLGVVFAILSLTCSTYSMVLIKPILSCAPIITLTMYRMIFSTCVLLLFGIVTKRIAKWREPILDKKFRKKLFSSMLIVAFGGFYCALVALKHCPLVVISAINSLGPLFVFLFMVLFYKHKPKKRELFGILFIIFGIALICFE